MKHKDKLSFLKSLSTGLLHSVSGQRNYELLFLKKRNRITSGIWSFKRWTKKNVKALARSQSHLLSIASNSAFMICIWVWARPFNIPFHLYTNVKKAFFIKLQCVSLLLDFNFLNSISLFCDYWNNYHKPGGLKQQKSVLTVQARKPQPRYQQEWFLLETQNCSLPVLVAGCPGCSLVCK